MVSMNGFLYPDPQLTSILHSAGQVFESTPHNRPDIPISYWSRFVFSEDYLQRVNPNLALNIYTAVSNPITNDGRAKITRGCLQHRDLRGGLSPDHVPPANSRAGGTVHPVRVPVIVLQSTEDTLVSAANVDPFLAGRNTKHLWSHQLNKVTDNMMLHAADPNGGWVGKRATGTEDYQKYSLLGKMGLSMLMDTLKNPRGAFVVWARSGHAVIQENKAAMMDLLDALVSPTEEYLGLQQEPPASAMSGTQGAGGTGDLALRTGGKQNAEKEEERATAKMEVLFKLEPPKKSRTSGSTTGAEAVNTPEDLEAKQKPPSPERKNISFALSTDRDTKGEPQVLLQADAILISQEKQEAKTYADEKGSKEEFSSDFPAQSKEEEPYATSDAKRDEAKHALSPQAKSSSPQNLRPSTTDEMNSLITTISALNPPAPGTPKPLHPYVSGSSSDALASEEIKSGSPPRASSLVDPVQDKSFNESFGPGTHPHPSFPQKIDEKSVSSTDMDLDRPTSLDSIGGLGGPSLTIGMEESSVLSVHSSSEVKEEAASAADKPKSRLGHHQDQSKDEAEASVAALAAVEAEEREMAKDQRRVAEEQQAKLVKDLDLNNLEATKEQKMQKQWTASVPDPDATLELEGELLQRQKKYALLEDKQKHAQAEDAAERIKRFDDEQKQRRQQYENEDKQLLLKLQRELEDRRKERDMAERQRRLQIQEIEQALIGSGIVTSPSKSQAMGGYDGDSITTVGPSVTFDDTQDIGMGASQSIDENRELVLGGGRDPVKEVPPMRYEDPNDLPSIITETKDVNSQLDRMLNDEEDARKRGNMSMEDFEKVKMQMANRQMERDMKLRNLASGEQEELFELSAAAMQRVARGYNGRKRARAAREAKEMNSKKKKAVLSVQKSVRGFLGRRRFARVQRIYQMNLLQGQSVIAIQSIFRGYCARRYFKKVRRFLRSREIQRVFRGHLGRQAAAREKQRLNILRQKNNAAARIQSTWRMKLAREEFRSLRIHVLAAIECQRAYRGYLGRKQFARRREWDAAAPGPDRIKLGLKLIDESKVAFERQQEEIDALHRAQERAEARVSHIHSEMKDAEKELSVLERELTEIDQIERDLQTLSHEKDLLLEGVSDAAGMPRNAESGHAELVLGRESHHGNDPDLERRRRAEAYVNMVMIRGLFLCSVVVVFNYYWCIRQT